MINLNNTAYKTYKPTGKLSLKFKKAKNRLRTNLTQTSLQYWNRNANGISHTIKKRESVFTFVLMIW